MKRGQKPKRQPIIGVVGAIFFLIYFVCSRDNSGVSYLVTIFLIFIALCILAFYVFANAYAKKNKYKIVAANNIMNDSFDLSSYYSHRDEMIKYLTVMADFQLLISKQHITTPKPSVVLKQLEENEELQVSAAITRMTTNYKEAIRKNGLYYSTVFSTQLNEFRYRLSSQNYSKAEGCLREIQNYESAVGTIEEIDGMDGIEFEHWCAELLEKNGFNSIIVTPSSGDQGVDITAEKDDIHYAIQCKCYSSDLGNTPVQEVYAGKEMYGCQVGVVMTNRFFTTGAKELAAKTKVLLWDRDKLCDMLDTYTRNNYYS
ncbi:MAG: restriction endonuclease [Oscillospiraceae bacterium]|nr:restriction endonuclease [Oscillospiraceae bacterium]